MTAAVILNIVFATLVVGGIVALLSWGIVTDRTVAARRTRPARRPARRVTTQPARAHHGRALDLNIQ
jgi:hypothetical protein